MNMQQMRYLIAVSKFGSISSAAKKMYVTQSNISKAIVQLETEMGFQILQRHSRGISFTPRGLELLHASYRLVDEFDSVQKRFSSFHVNGKTLSVASQHYMFVLIAMNDMIKEMSADEFNVLLYEMKTSDILKSVSSHSCSIGFIYYYDITHDFLKKTLDELNLVFSPLLEAKPHAYISTNHPLKEKNLLTMQDLMPYPYIRYDIENDSSHFAEEIISPENDRQIIRVTDRSSMFKLIQHGTCYTIGSGCVPEGFSEAGVKTVPLKCKPSAKMTIGWIKSKTLELDDVALRFLELCKNAMVICSKNDPYINILP